VKFLLFENFVKNYIFSRNIHLYSPEMVASKKEIQKFKNYTIIKSESKK